MPCASTGTDARISGGSCGSRAAWFAEAVASIVSTRSRWVMVIHAHGRKGGGPARRSGPPEAVAVPADGLDRRRVLAQLLAQGAHDGVHDVAAARVLVAPDLREQLAPRDHLALAVVQVADDPELERRQGELPAVEAQLARVEVD